MKYIHILIFIVSIYFFLDITDVFLYCECDLSNQECNLRDQDNIETKDVQIVTKKVPVINEHVLNLLLIAVFIYVNFEIIDGLYNFWIDTNF